nr:hypothetical protein [Tanacetum cinerariifolium]
MTFTSDPWSSKAFIRFRPPMLQGISKFPLMYSFLGANEPLIINKPLDELFIDHMLQVILHKLRAGIRNFRYKGRGKEAPYLRNTFLTTAKAVIKFDKGTITQRSKKNKMSFHRIPKFLCKVGKGIKNKVRPIAPTMTMNMLVLEWEERIKLHREKEMKFDQWRSKNFKNKRPALVKVENEMDDE